MGFPRLCSAMPLLPDFLHLVKCFNVDDSRVCVVENCLILNRIFAGRFVPDGIGVGFEVDRTAGVLTSFQNIRYAP